MVYIQMNKESIENKDHNSMCVKDSQESRMDGVNRVNLIEDGTNTRVQELITLKKLVPRYLPLVSSNFSNAYTVLHNENDEKRLMFPMEVLQRIQHLVLQKFSNQTQIDVQGMTLNIEIITNYGRIEVDEALLYISASSEELIRETGRVLAGYMKEVNKALRLNSILLCEDNQEITLNVSSYLTNVSDENVELGLEVIECSALNNLEILSMKAAGVGLKNISEDVKGGLLLHKVQHDQIFAQLLDSSTIFSDSVVISRINGVSVRSEYELFLLWNCIKSDLYQKIKQGLEYSLLITFVTATTKFKDSIKDPEIIVNNAKSSNSYIFDIDSLYDTQDISENPINNSVDDQMNFKQKVLPLFQFISAGCEEKVLKQMWKMHCNFIGKNCGAKCSCLLHLPRLFDDVSSADDQSGFLLSFCPRFHKNLRKDFPGDLPMKIIDNLLYMWELHKSSDQLDNACTESCCCQDFWSLFRHSLNIHILAQPAQVINLDSIPRLNLKPLGQSEQAPEFKDNNGYEVHDERISLAIGNIVENSDSYNISAESTATSDGVEMEAEKESSLSVVLLGEKTNGKRKSNALRGKPSKQICSEVNDKTCLRITFNAKNPLGFYCFTKKDRDRRSYCVIFSVCPLQTDRRLRRGLIIDKTSLANEETGVRKQVSSHETLKRRYEAAKSRSENIVLWFLLDDSLFSGDIDAQYPENPNYWSQSGGWQGPSILGWAGGAETALINSLDGIKEDPTEMSVVNKSLKSELKYSHKLDPSPSLKAVAMKIAEISASTIGYNATLSENQNPRLKRVSFDESCKESDMDSEAKSYKRKNKLEFTHAWSDKVRNFYCQKCEKRRQKLQTCELCQCCHNCGLKSPCPNESKRNNDQSRLLAKRYQQALKAAFGLTTITTCEYNVESMDDDTKNETSEKVNPDISIAMELINQEPSLINRPLIDPVIGHSDNILHPFAGKTLLFAVTMYARYDVLLQLLIAEADAAHRDSNNKTPLECAREYCNKLEIECKNSNSLDKQLNSKLEEFVLKRDLLSIFSKGIDLFNVYSVVNSWYTVQVSIDGGKNINLSKAGKSHPSPNNLYCVISLDNMPDAHRTSVVPVTTDPTWTNSKGYFFNVNSMNKEALSGKYMKFELYKGNPEGNNVKLSEITEKGNVVIYHANTSGTTGEFMLPEKEMLSSGTLIITVRKILHERHKSVTKPLLENEVKKQENYLATELPKLIEDIINHCNAVKTREQYDNENTARIDYTTAVLNKLKCLHFAVYLESLPLVHQLVSYAANVDEVSQHGTPLELAQERITDSVSDNLNKIISELIRAKEPAATDIVVKSSDTNNTGGFNNNDGRLSRDSQQILRDGHLANSATMLLNPKTFVDAYSNINTPPMMDNPNWMLPNGTKPCFAYKCSKGADCKFIHISIPDPSLLTAPCDEIKLKRYIEQKFGNCFYPNVQERKQRGSDGQLWYTAAYQCPKSSTIYYAAGGQRGMCNTQNIWWYPSPEYARSAVEFLVLVDMEKSQDKSFFYSECDDNLPMLETPDWMLKYPKRKACFAFYQVAGQKCKCQKGANCSFSHVYTPRCSIPENSYVPGGLCTEYYSCYNVDLKSGDFQHTSKQGKNSDTWWHTAGFTCPVTSTIYTSCKGRNGKFSSQKIWWYPSVHDALCAVEAVVLNDLRFNMPLLNPSDVGTNKIGVDTRYLPLGPDRFTSVPESRNNMPTRNILEQSLPLEKFAPAFTNSFSTSHENGYHPHPQLFSRPSNPHPTLPIFNHSPHAFENQIESNDINPEYLSSPLGKFGPISLHSMSSPSEPRRIPARPFHPSPIIEKSPSPPIGKFSPIARPPPSPPPSPPQSRPFIQDNEVAYKRNETLDTSSTNSIPQSQSEMKSNFKMFGNSHLPILEDPNWMLAAPKSSICYAFNRPGSCKKGIRCKYAHLYIPPSDTLDDSYEAGAIDNFYKNRYGIELHKNDFHHIGKSGKGTEKWWAAAFKCPKTATIYYASGGQNAQYSTQGMWWYPSFDDARRAVEGVVLSDLKNRNMYSTYVKEESESSDSDESVQFHGKYSNPNFHLLAMYSPEPNKKSTSKEVPILNRKDWILDDVGKRACPSFCRDGTCAEGNKCSLAHIYKFKGKLPELPPDPKALFLTYEKHGFNFGSCNRFIKSEKGRNGKIWYTAAVMCPIDSTIYHAAGGENSHRSKQKLCTDANLFWYPSEESAKAACDGIVLYALRDRDEVTNIKNNL